MECLLRVARFLESIVATEHCENFLIDCSETLIDFNKKVKLSDDFQLNKLLVSY